MRIAVLSALIILLLGCVGPGGDAPPGNETPANGTVENASDATLSDTTIRIASFNIQIFGQSKRSDPLIMDVLAKTARNFDIMLVQELRDSTETTLPFYLERINAFPGPRYAAVSSPRLGRTSSKENYAYIYNTDRVELLSDYTFSDPPPGTSADLFQREPFIASFRSGNLTFVLIGIHTDPDEAPQEIRDLALVLEDARSEYPGEDDFMVLGDLNADCSYFGPSDETGLRNFTWLVPDDADTTTKSTDCAYDRMIITDGMAEDYSGSWGIFRFDEIYGLNQSFTEEVSDHYPVYADFG